MVTREGTVTMTEKAITGSIPKAGSYIRALDGIRACSILLVILAHTAPLGPKSWLMNEVAARMGMALFFCLSGYLITSILYKNQDIRAFLIKRLLRIVPAVYLYLTILLIFFGLPPEAYFIHLLFIANYATSALDVGPVSHLWSLSVEIHFYLIIAFLVWIGGRRMLWLIPPAALVITGLRIDAGVVSNINTHLRVDEILAGGTLALASIHYGDVFRRWFSSNWVAGGTIVVLTLLFMISAHEDGGFLVYLRPYFSMALVGTVIHCRIRPLLAILESRIAAYIARISYSLYIYHPLMIFGVMNAGTVWERYLFKRPISYLLTWGAAHFSTFFWERRWQEKARKWVGRR